MGENWFSFFYLLFDYMAKHYTLGPMNFTNISTEEDLERNEYRFMIEQPIYYRR